MAAKKSRVRRKRKPRSLLIQKLEFVSKNVFKRYFNVITDLIGNSPGIYALYNDNELYYVGKSTDLKSRVRHHLRDRHKAGWTHFSLYLVRKSEHIDEIESLIISISGPKGNRSRPKGKAGSMLKKLQAIVKDKLRQEYDDMFGLEKSRTTKRKKQKRKERNLKGLVAKDTQLYKEYKGKEYYAILTPNGIINIKNKKYTSPTGAALSIVDRKTVNGWRFWFIQDSDGVWITLDEYSK